MSCFRCGYHTCRCDGRKSVPPEKHKDFTKNNPKNEPVGNFTGRCYHCGSSDLWTDNLAYGCNFCGKFLGGN